MNNQSKFSVDEKTATCQVCRVAKFSLIKRRHLCTMCGKTICANCGVASANTLLSSFRKKDRESNTCIICQRQQQRSTSAAASASPPHQQQVDSAAAPVAFPPLVAAVVDAVQVPTQKPLPPSQRSEDCSALRSIEAATHPKDTPHHHISHRQDDSSSVLTTTPLCGVAADGAPHEDWSQQVDWTMTTCRLCCRGFTTERRRLLCPTCHHTVCSQCTSGKQQGGSSNVKGAECTRCSSTHVGQAVARGPDNPVGAIQTRDHGRIGSVAQRHVVGSLLARPVAIGAPPALGASVAVSSLLGGGGAASMSFRPASMIRRPQQQAASPHRRGNHKDISTTVVEVGSVKPNRSSVVGGSSFVGAASIMRRAAFGAHQAVGSMRSMSMALTLGTTPMGSLPAHFFQSRKQQLQLPGSNGVPLMLCESQRQLAKLSSMIPQDARPGLDRVTYIADIVGPYLARDHLRVSVDLLLERHPLLRCGIVDDQLRVYPSASADFRCISAANVGTTFAAAERLFLNEISKPFDLTSASSLLRVRLLERGGGDPSSFSGGGRGGGTTNQTSSNSALSYTIAIVCHRMIANASDISLFVSDLRTLYQHANSIVERNQSSGTVSVRYDVVRRVLPQQPPSFDTFCQLEQEYLSSGFGIHSDPAAVAARQFWAEEVERRVPLEFPVDHPRSPSPCLSTSLHTVPLTNAVTTAITQFAKASGITQKTAVLAVFHILLQRYTQQESVTIALQPQLQHLGDLDEYRDTLGPVRDVQLFFTLGSAAGADATTATTSCIQFAREVQHLVHACEHHYRYPLHQRLQAPPNGGGTPTDLERVRPAQVCFTEQPSDVGSYLLHMDGASTPFAGLEWRSSSRYRGSIRRSSPFELELHYWETRGGRMHLVLEYSNALLNPDTIQRFADDFLVALRHAGDGGGTTFTTHTLPCVASGTVQKLLFDFNNNPLECTGTLLDRGRGVLGLWEAALPSARSTTALSMPEVMNGEAGALSSIPPGGQISTLTYAELDARSNMLAHFLRHEPIAAGRHSVVAIAMPRCVEQLVCVLGILKAGAAYLPLDVSYPVDRLEFMLADSDVACVLTTVSTRDGNLAPLFQSCPKPVLCVADDFDKLITSAWGDHQTLPPEIDIDPSDACYVIYTSGSTGKPKGVVQNHRALSNLILWQNSYLPTTMHQQHPNLNVLQFSPISFDVSFQELFSTWSVGGTLFMVSEELRLDPQQLIRFLNRCRIQRIFLPFVALSHICETACEINEFPSTLVDIITAGEQLVITRPLVECLERLKACNGGDHQVVVHNHYGPSETHVCSYYVLSGDPHTWPALPPIGRPVSNTQLYVLDEKRQLLPLGAVGELFIAGDCLGTGYLGRDDATAASFVDCPFASASSVKMYKTGDLVQMKPDGNILYIRRKDTQVKIRGFRIELGEVEARLGQSELVKKCCVVVRDDCSGGKTLVAYIVAQSHSTAMPHDGPEDVVAAARVLELKRFLASSMPPYMIPSIFVFLGNLPLTPSGKVNRKALPPPTESDVQSSAGVGAGGGTTGVNGEGTPVTAMELRLARIWSDVLKRPLGTIHIHSNFFELGGHSLTITKVASRVTTELKTSGATSEVPLGEYFKHPSLGAQASMIARISGVSGQATLPPAGDGTASAPVFCMETEACARAAEAERLENYRIPLTYNQQSLAYLCFLRPEAAAVYNISLQGKLVVSNMSREGGAAQGLGSAIDISAADVSDAFEGILRSHASLRTTYHQDENGVFYQDIHEDQELDFNVVQLDEEDVAVGSSTTTSDDCLEDEEMRELIRAESVRPFNLTSDSLMRVRLYIRGPVQVLQLVLHHIAVDLWSIDQLLDEWIGAMGGTRKGGPPARDVTFTTSNSAPGRTQFKRPAATYAEYAQYQLLQDECGEFAKSSMAWKRLLDLVNPRELPVLDLPTDFPRPLVQTFTGGLKTFTISKKLCDNLTTFVRRHGTTMYVALLSIVSIVLHKYARQDEIVLGTPMACRNLQRFEQTVGYFINAIPIRASFTGEDQTVADLLGACGEYLHNALEHQDYPFPLIADRVVGSTSRSAARSPVFQALFTYQAAPLHQEIVPFVMYREGHRMPINPSVSWESISIPTGHSMYDLVFQFGMQVESPTAPASLLGTIEYNADLFAPSTIETFVSITEWVAEQVCKHDGEISVAKISTAPPAQQQRQLNVFNRNPKSSTDPDRTIQFGHPNSNISIRLARNDEAHFVKLFSAIARSYPNLPAVAYGYAAADDDVVPGGTGPSTITFAELDAVTNQMSRVMLQKYPQLGPNRVVGVSIRRSPEMLQVMLAVMKTGAAYVPVDPGYPTDRIEYMASDSGCMFMVCRYEDAQPGASLSGPSLSLLTLEELLPAAAAASSEPLSEDILQRMSADDLAYVIYTSGSTGKPKGTLLEHRGLVNLCYAIQFGYHMEFAKTAFLLFASSSFDASVLELFAPLAIASTVVMLSEKTLVGETLALAMKAARVTTAVLPPSVLSVMTEEFFPPPSLKVLVTAGEAINDELLQRWRGRVHMINGYGPTENTVCSTVCDYDAEGIVLTASHAQYVEHRDHHVLSTFANRVQPGGGNLTVVKQPPIGRPLANYRCYVVDSQLQLVGIGVPGELLVSSPGVARGYHNLPERTALSFVANVVDPTAEYPRMYRTGDLVRWVGNGLLEYLGRIDQQVKLRGYRIELGEIEATILKFQHSKAFADCAVELRTVSGAKCLVAYIVPVDAFLKDDQAEGRSPSVISLQDLKLFLKKTLPDYMVPSAFVSLRCLPLTPSGKVDRKNLPMPPSTDNAQQLLKMAPQTPTEAVLLVLAQEVLGSAALGIDDDFFDVGGHSLAAMQLVARVRDHLGVDISVAKLFELSRLTSLAAFIDAVRSTDDEPVAFSSNHLLEEPAGASAATTAEPTRFPLSFNQESLWFAYTVDKSAATFNVSLAGRCVGAPLNMAALAKAVRAIVILNPMLRSAYAEFDTTPQMMVRSTCDVNLIRGAITQDTTVEDFIHKPLDIEAGEVMRVYVLDEEQQRDNTQESKKSTILVFVFHHIVSDLASMETFIRQIGALYHRAATPGSDLERMDLTTDLVCASSAVKCRIANDVGETLGGVAGASYIDFAFHQRELVASRKGERLRNYWQRQLSGYPAFTALPTDLVRPARPTLRGGAAIGKLEVSTVERVIKAARLFGTTPLTVYLTALFAWLFRVTGQTDVVVGMPVTNRTRSELQNIVGDFVNLCPIRLQMDAAEASAPGDHEEVRSDEKTLPSASNGRIASSISFQSLARRAKSALLGALMHQEYPFLLTVQNLQQYRDPSRAPIFQVLLVHEKTHHSMTQLSPFILGDAGGSISLGGDVSLESLQTSERTCSYDLVFALSEGDHGRVDFRIQYAKDLFVQQTVERFAAQYVALLEAALASPTVPFEALSMVPLEEREYMIERNRASRQRTALSPEALHPGGGVTLHAEFEAAVRKHGPQRALFDTAGVSYTYDALNAAANTVARSIRRAAMDAMSPEGSTRFCDHPVCIFLPRSVEYVIAVVGAAKSNCPYTPVDCKTPLSRASYIFQDSGCVAILTIRSLVSTLEAILQEACPTASSPAMICLDELLDSTTDTTPSSNAEDNVPNTSSWEDCLYTIYTSGSTGMPKGVRIHHGGVVNVCRWFIREHCVVPGDVSAQALGAAFDPVTIELWPYLLAGASVVIMDDDSKFGGPEATLAFLDKYAVTHLTFPTVLSQLIFDSVVEFPKTLHVRSWSCGGDKFKGTTRPLPFSLINAYGPTECCVLCSQYPVNFPVPPRRDEDALPGDAVMRCRPPDAGRISVDPPLGEPTANTALYVLDRHGNMVPRGVVGELCVGGAQVGMGYRKRPDVTEKVFTEDTFGLHSDLALPPARLYHTGDLVKMDHEYHIHFVGRRDFQVKIRGFRIELGEIEAQIMNAAPDVVGNAICIAYQPSDGGDTSGGDSGGEKKLIAFVKVREAATLHGDPSTDGAPSGDAPQSFMTIARKHRTDILAKLKSRLPDYMVPSMIVFLASLPLTPNGKVDRAQLPQMISDDLCGVDDGGQLGAGARRFVPPTTRDEQTLCTIWEELLRTKPIGLTDDWYEKGGSSLTSTMLLSRMRQVFQMEITLQQFFGDPTVTGLLNIVREKGNSTVAHSLTSVLEHDACALDASITAIGRVATPDDDIAQEIEHQRAAAGLLLPYDPSLPPRNVFITGVTGFLGAFILKHFLEALPGARIFCLVRAKTEADANERVFSNLVQYQLLDDCNDIDEWMRRVVPVVGDLAQDHFGLSLARFQELATVVDCIVHNGALVNFSYPYVSLKAANVGGTVTSLKLATTIRLKPMHFISTLSTVPTGDAPGSRSVSERLLSVASEELHGGYTQTKWVAERLVALAATERGVPCTIVRPGRITGHSTTGACNLDDFLNLFIKGCVELAAIPELNMPCEMTPVDFCAQAIFDIATRHFQAFPVPPGCPAVAPALPAVIAPQFIYHLTNTSAMPWAQVMKIVCRQGNYGDLVTMPFRDWRNERLLALNNTTHCALIPLVPMFGEGFAEEVAPLDVRVDHLDTLLAHSGSVCPKTSEALVMTYVKYFLERGFLPATAGTAFERH